MQVTEKLLNSYRARLGKLETTAGEFMKEYLDAYRALSPNAPVAEMREVALAAIETVLNTFGAEAGEESIRLFNKICAAEGLDVQPEYYDAIDRERMDGKVRWFATELEKGNSEVFTRSVTDLTRFYVQRNAYENMVRNCDKNKVRYARVPSGRETCGFCFMLCSRGFVYHSEMTAGLGHAFHFKCDCIVTPGVQGVTKIDGYNPDKMYERWKQCADTIGADPDSKSRKELKKIITETETHDFKWLYSGIEPPVDYSEVPRSKFGTLIKEGDYSKENIKNRGNEWRDLIIHDAFSQCGFNIKPLEANAPKGYKNIDSFLNGKLCEMKSPNGVINLESKDPYRFVEKNLRTAKEQFEKRYDESTGGLPKKVGQIRVIFNSFYHNGDDDEIAKRLSIEMEKHGINEVFLLDKSKKIRRIK